MKIGAISDIHANLSAFEAVLSELKKRGVEKIFNAGDNVGYSVFPNECIELLKDDQIISAKGNYDDAVGSGKPVCGCGEGSMKTQALRLLSLNWAKKNTSSENKIFLAGLNAYPSLNLNGRKILVMHGGMNALNEFIYKEDDAKFEEIARKKTADIIIMGHTHRSFVITQYGKLFVNPGSVGKPEDGNTAASCAVIDLADNCVEILRIKYDITRNIEAMTGAGISEEIVRDLETGIPFSRN